jgi:hypothetical protein
VIVAAPLFLIGAVLIFNALSVNLSGIRNGFIT